MKGSSSFISLTNEHHLIPSAINLTDTTVNVILLDFLKQQQIMHTYKKVENFKDPGLKEVDLLENYGKIQSLIPTIELLNPMMYQR
ncbi:hypothetical protein Smp_191210 [Schistosoma mansoni]|uniref:hypothetical protein n=1 Tax=Schistosoma mansoni TaxID=6183 RepID=UPI00022DC316|nr:hypothetical protein Smp_191210 [Schistosoma mansoni]|eukprot:XP_018648270.1 hypothetical protein Smp_191210 [Schistosoma mansoni]